MAWPFPDFLRPLMRMASYWLDRDWSFQQIVDWAAGKNWEGHGADMAEAVPEAARANYFRDQIQTRDPTTPFSTLWGWFAKGAWYAGYGHAPSPEQRQWAYQRPDDSIGLMIEVRGQTASGGQPRRFTVTVNAPWSMSLAEVEAAVREQLTGGTIDDVIEEYDALDPGTIQLELAGGALIARQQPTIDLT